MKAFARALLAVFVLIALSGAAAVVVISRRGLSAQVEPTRLETAAARALRGFSTPRDVRARRNPVAPTPAVLGEALAHYADHCAGCHANDGSGDTAVGRNLYPRAPDMRLEPTQQLTDGELFWVIEHGIRHTGMPGWGDGTPESERTSWGLVHFIRRLSSLTDEQLDRMGALNPKTPAQLEEEEDARRFLAGEDPPEGASGETPAAAHRH